MTTNALEQPTYQSLRPYLFAVAYRMTGSASDAEDLIHDAWLRYLDADSPRVDSLRAYLTTIVSRLALDYLKSARNQREHYLGPWLPEPVATREAIPGPAEIVEQREDVSIAFLTLLERLTPDQRVIYVLREAFGFSYDEIADHLGKSPTACRQILHRAQLRLSAERRPAAVPRADHLRISEQFQAALSTGDAAALARLLAPDVEWIADAGANRLAVRRTISGRDRVSRGLAGFARKWLVKAKTAFDIVDLNGSPSIVVRYDGDITQVTVLDIADDQIIGIRNILNLDKLRYLAKSMGHEVASVDPRLLEANHTGS